VSGSSVTVALVGAHFEALLPNRSQGLAGTYKEASDDELVGSANSVKHSCQSSRFRISSQSPSTEHTNDPQAPDPEEEVEPPPDVDAADSASQRPEYVVLDIISHRQGAHGIEYQLRYSDGDVD